ncbi:hypothetical protein ML603_08205 [Streptococcus dysgalactiae subsp. equisimilis]|uniref:hypothetical protein n=1 Tax=Streptococcus dysgalactiae TaxID=1334 RepID=UPI001F1351A5|nr:hypothetical protein [Streptococcus dysgalactiae]UMY67853.1 hypothetical protein ML603_08205 [Streptococcus dysgalactiae subsp. equisimilis]
MRNWKVTGNYPQYDGTGSVVATQAIIADDKGSVITEKVKKDLRTANDSEIIEAVLEEFKKTTYVEIAMGEAVQKVDEQAKIIDNLNAYKLQLEKMLPQLKQAMGTMQFVVAKNIVLTPEESEKILWDYPEWQADKKYKQGDLVRFDRLLFEVSEELTSSLDEQPQNSAKYKQISAEAVKVTARPWDENEDWNEGDLTIFEGKTYKSLQNNNAYSPKDKPDFWQTVEE